MFHKLKDLFRSLEENDVRYLVIGGIAAGLYGVPRNTFDLDIVIEPTQDNADRLLKALASAGLGTASLTDVPTVLKNEITTFQDYVAIDVFTRTPGLRFDDAWSRRATKTYKGQAFHVVCLEDLIASKRASGRSVDLEDARMLEASPDLR
ncbi:nucleotidyltransferase [Candidatus Sumerlaeota bacterium]|nr:nucleotidyltransferase [Candidatus Sumerlaeota bacterium]